MQQRQNCKYCYELFDNSRLLDVIFLIIIACHVFSLILLDKDVMML